MPPPEYTAFKALSFDIFGTLIDWEPTIIEMVNTHLASNRLDNGEPRKPLTKEEIIPLFVSYERQLEAKSPDAPYREIAGGAYIATAKSLFDSDGDMKMEAEKQAEELKNGGVGKWPAFADTVEAMKRLGKYYKLIALSNIDEKSFDGTLTGPLKDVKFDGVYIAEDIGSYKPDLKNFKYLFKNARDSFGIEMGEILHVAHSLQHDHVPAKEIGMEPSVWIERGDGHQLKEYEGKLNLGARFDTLKEFADAVEEAWKAKEREYQNQENNLEGKPEVHVDKELEVLEEKGLGGS